MHRSETAELDEILRVLIYSSDADPISPARVANDALELSDRDMRAGWDIRLAAFVWFRTRAAEMILALDQRAPDPGATAAQHV